MVQNIMSKKIYTIGYSGFILDTFLKTLKDNGINVVIDVRSTPYSEWFQDFNKTNIEIFLKKNNIYYRNYAEEFGARQENKAFFNDEGYLDFGKFAKSEQFRKGFEKICNSIEQGYNIVLMCAEKNPIQCHRSMLIAKEFHDAGYEVVHILPEGKFLTQNQLEIELLNEFFPNRDQINLFEAPMTEQEYIAEAYKKQNQKIGYRANKQLED